MASESKEEPEQPVMEQMYAISHILELIHDFIKSRGGPGVNIDNLELDDDIDFNVLYRLIPDGGDRKRIMAHYNREPRVYATLRNLLIDIASIITGESVSIEDAGCICIGELKRQFGYFGGRNPYTAETSYSHRIPLSGYTLGELLKSLGVTYFFTEATGSASKTLLSANIGERVIPTSVVADPGGRLPGDPEDGSSFTLAVDPILGNITITYNKGRTTIRFSNFPGIEISRLPSVYIATALASLIPNFMRQVTRRGREQPPPGSLPRNFSEASIPFGTATSNSGSGATPSYAESDSSGPPGTPQTRLLPSLEDYLEGRSFNGEDDIESHIDEWVRQRGNLDSLTSDTNLNTYIGLIKAYLDDYRQSARARARTENNKDSDYDPEERERFLETIQELVSDEEEEDVAASVGKKRSSLKTYEYISLADRKNMCRLALAILQRCLGGDGSFKHRIQTAIRTILTLKSLGDRVPMEELMTLIGDGDTCAIASIDKLFLANCILYANITGRHVVTVEVVKRGGKSSMLIIDHDGSRGATLTPAQREARDRERAAAEAERAAEKAKRNKEAADARQSKAKELAARRSERNILLKGELYKPRTSFRRESRAPIEISDTTSTEEDFAEQPRRSQRIAALREPQPLNGHRCDNGAPWRYNLIRAPGNGSCLFGAIIIAMLRMYTQDGEAELRRRVVEFMRNNREIYNDPIILGLFGVALDTYINRMENDGVWGGLTEIITVEMMLGQCINVWIYNDENECYELWYGNGNPNCLNILYNGYNHYDALLPVGRADVLPVNTIAAAAAAAPPETPEQRRAKILAALKKRGVSGGSRSHRQRKTLKKRKDRRFTRRT